MIGQASVTRLDLAILGTAIIVMAAFFWMFGYTKLGRAMRSVGMNPKAAQLVGVNLNRIHTIIWGLSGAISAIAALLISPKLLMTADMGTVVTLGFAAAIVGGFTSLPGAVVGGFIIGIVEQLVGLFVSSRAITVAPFLAIMLVLILRPQGLFGGRIVIKKV
jgi:branched-chain amino acid transport system permease protein